MNWRGRRIGGVMAVLLALAAGVAVAGPGGPTEPGQPVPLAQVSHIHGMAIDRADPARLYLATHYGLYVAAPDGRAARISRTADDFMGFTAHPADPGTFYASGHPAGGGNLGFIQSTDGGVTWQPLSKGVGGPVDFHQMDVSKADPRVVYGVHGGLQVSRDGGKTWQIAGPAPEGMIALAAGARSPDTVYAATRGGLLVSRDGGKSWQRAHMLKRPVPMVHVAADGMVYAYMAGTGLIKTPEGGSSWITLGALDQNGVILHLTIGPDRMVAATGDGQVIESRDEGRSWRPLGKP